MVLSNQMTPGMTISLNNKLYRVESCVKVTVPKGAPFIKAKLRNLSSGEVSEKSFKLNQAVKDVTLAERPLEFLYLEGDDYLFLDISTLEQVLVPASVVRHMSNYLRAGVEVKASLYGDSIFAVDLPQFLELMVGKTENISDARAPTPIKVATLETGAKIEVPSFIEIGDIIKVDTRTEEYVQRM